MEDYKKHKTSDRGYGGRVGTVSNQTMDGPFEGLALRGIIMHWILLTHVYRPKHRRFLAVYLCSTVSIKMAFFHAFGLVVALIRMQDYYP